MALKPLGDRIVVRFEETEEKTASGFVLAGASHEATKTAEVLVVGEGIRTLTGELIAPSVATGDKVLRSEEQQAIKFLLKMVQVSMLKTEMIPFQLSVKQIF